METKTEQNSDRLTTSQPSTPLSRWVGEQVTAVAEAFGESLTPARLKIYADNLTDIDRARLAAAFRRAVRERTFFPKVAELRKLADADDELRTNLEAENAWQLVERDLADNSKNARPHLDARTEYAIRAAGGRLGINAVYSASITDEAFTKKRFVEAFKNYDAAQNLGLDSLQLPGGITANLLSGGARKALAITRQQHGENRPHQFRPALKAMPNPLSDEEIEARRALLREQAEQLCTQVVTAQ
jgi:hypothetical protein